MNNYDEMIEVIQALKDGKIVEYKRKECGPETFWDTISGERVQPTFALNTYRVKKEPRTLIGYVPVCKLLTADYMFLGSPQETEAGAWRYAESSGKSTVIDVFEIVYVEKL